MSEQTDTPETDTESARIFELTASPGEIFCEWEKFSRKLERDRNEWKSVAEGDLLGVISQRDALLAALQFVLANHHEGRGEFEDIVIAAIESATGEKP